jgi:2-haloacid dehalogenase
MKPAPITPRTVIFDFGGVLMDWNPRYLYRKLFDDEQTMERFLREIDFVEWNTEQDRGHPFAAAVADLSRRFPQYAPMIRAYDERWHEMLAGPIHDTVEILHALKAAGHRLHGLSNWSVEKFPMVRSAHSFFEQFETITLSGEVKLIKPDPAIFTLMLERIGARAEECVFIDDTQPNIDAARALGFVTILFRSPAQLRDELLRLGLLPAAAQRA